MMEYKPQITKYVEYVEDNLNLLLKDVQANRTQDIVTKLTNMIRQVEYLSNLVELEK